VVLIEDPGPEIKKINVPEFSTHWTLLLESLPSIQARSKKFINAKFFFDCMRKWLHFYRDTLNFFLNFVTKMPKLMFIELSSVSVDFNLFKHVVH
jgi:hypothetical protein